MKPWEDPARVWCMLCKRGCSRHERVIRVRLIFEPMPFKGDENMLVDAKDRAALDDDEGENQLLFGFDGDANKAANGS